MSEEQVQAKGIDLVLRPIGEVFNAVVDPAVLSHFFISGASGPLEPGKTVEWQFGDVGAKLDVTVHEVNSPHRIVFEWAASGAPGTVEMTFTEHGPDRTQVDVTESGFALTAAGVRRALQQTAGWTDFLCCLKAYLQHGVNLREGRGDVHA